MNNLARTALCLFACIALFASCDDSAARKAKDLLQYIPADTPYVVAFTEPLPEDLQERFEPAMDRMLSAYERVFRLHSDEIVAGLSAEEGGAEKAARFAAVMDEVMALMSVESWRNAGIGRGTIFAIYGDGLLPVIRLALTDIDGFEDMLARFEEVAGERLATGTVDGHSYRFRDLEEARLVIATEGNDAVLTVVPVEYSDERLARALGFEKPRRSLHDSDELKSIASKYDFTEHAIGFIDVERIVSIFTGDPSGSNAELLQIAGYDPSALTPQCRKEFADMAGIAPRMVVGYTAVNSKYLDSQMIVELREDIAAGLATLPALVPGLGSDSGGLFSFGFSLDPMALRSFIEARLDAMEADPFKCASLASMQASTVAGREALQKPLPPMVYSFRGLLASVTDIKGIDFKSGKPPESVDGGVVLAMENIEALVGSAAMISPELAEIDLLPDGKARELKVPQLTEITKQAFAALSEDALAIGFGTGGDVRAETMLVAAPGASKPFASFSLDAQRYYELISEAIMEGEPEEGGEPMYEEKRAAIRDVLVASGELYDRMTVNVNLTERGVEVVGRVKLTDPTQE